MALDHVAVVLDHQHAEAVARVRTAAFGPTPPGPAPTAPHLTLVAFDGLLPDVAFEAVSGVARRTAPFVARAHGLGIFSGSGPGELTLHVPVVRSPALARLQERLVRALRACGAAVSGDSEAAIWSPHVTLVDRGMDADVLACAVRRLAARPHPSWRLPVTAVDLLVARGGQVLQGRTAGLGGGTFDPGAAAPAGGRWPGARGEEGRREGARG